MADYDSSLPVRSQADGSDERLHVKVVDGTNPAVNQMSVDADKNAHVEMHGDDPAAVDRVLRLSEAGALTPDGVYDASLNTKPGNIGLVAAQRAASPADADQIKRLTAISNGSVHALDISLHDEAGAAYSDTNPLPVKVSQSEGSKVCDPKAATAVVANASDSHDYTVTAAKTLILTQIEASASGKAKLELKIETAAASGTFVTKVVMFNSTADCNMQLKFQDAIEVPAGAKVRVTMTNKDNQPQDLYSTIIGHEIP